MTVLRGTRLSQETKATIYFAQWTFCATLHDIDAGNVEL